MGQDPSEIREEIEDTRARMSDTVEAIGYKTDVKTRAREKVSGKVEAVKNKVGAAGSRASEMTPDGEDVKQSARKAAGLAQQNPLGLALGSVAVGFLAGMLVPSTRIEDEKLGEVSDRSRTRSRRPPRRPASTARTWPTRPPKAPSKPPRRAAGGTPRSSGRPRCRRQRRQSRPPAPSAAVARPDQRSRRSRRARELHSTCRPPTPSKKP
jgi:Protein of unknown function (DUF3618)